MQVDNAGNFTLDLPPNQLALLSASLSKSVQEERTEPTPHQPQSQATSPEPKTSESSSPPSNATEVTAKMDNIHETLSRLFDDKLKDVAKASDLQTVIQKVDENAANFTRLSLRIKELEVKLADKRLEAEHKLTDLVRRELDERNVPRIERPVDPMSALESASSSSGSIAGPRGTRALVDRRINPSREAGRARQFEIARRSLKIWPIEGDDEQSLRAGVESFLTGALMMDTDDIDGLEILRVTRAREARYGDAYLETIVEFGSADARDVVAGLGYKLSAYTQGTRPTAGIRMVVPPFLAATFRTLQNVAFNLRREHGNGTKRHIKFEEDCDDLYLEVRLEGSRHWSKIDSALAKEIDREDSRRMLTSACPTAWKPPLSSPNRIPVQVNRPPPLRQGLNDVEMSPVGDQEMSDSDGSGDSPAVGGAKRKRMNRASSSSQMTGEPGPRPNTRLSQIRTEREAARARGHMPREEEERTRKTDGEGSTWRPPPPPPHKKNNN